MLWTQAHDGTLIDLSKSLGTIELQKDDKTKGQWNVITWLMIAPGVLDEIILFQGTSEQAEKYRENLITYLARNGYMIMRVHLAGPE